MHNLDFLISESLKYGPRKIAVVAAHGNEVIESIIKAESMGLVEPILIGDEQKINAISKEMNYNPGQVINEADNYKAVLLTIQLIKEGRAEVIMKGKIETAELIKPVLNKESGLRTNRLLSQVILFELPVSKKIMLLSDASLNISPTLAEKAGICKNAIDVAHAIGIMEPRVALLSAVEFVNPQIPSTVDAAVLTQMNKRGQITGAILDGPVALDTVLSAKSAEQKGLVSPVTEQTDILICPDVVSANILYRSISYIAGARSCGFVYGAQVPIILLSRAESAEVKLFSIALASIVANKMRG